MCTPVSPAYSSRDTAHTVETWSAAVFWICLDEIIWARRQRRQRRRRRRRHAEKWLLSRSSLQKGLSLFLSFDLSAFCTVPNMDRQGMLSNCLEMLFFFPWPFTDASFLLCWDRSAWQFGQAPSVCQTLFIESQRTFMLMESHHNCWV